MSSRKIRGHSIHTTFSSWNYITFEKYLQTNLQRLDLITKKADVDLIFMWLFVFLSINESFSECDERVMSS